MLFASQIVAAQLPEEVEEYFLREKKEGVPAIRRALTLPGTIPPPAFTAEQPGFKIDDTDLPEWIGNMEKFSAKFLDHSVNLRKSFPIPDRLPWQKVLPIFDPCLTNRQMVDNALKSQGLGVCESTDVDKFTGAGAEEPKLYLIERTVEPMSARSLPPKYAKLYFEGRMTRPIDLRRYGIGFGLYHDITGEYLDPRTVTLFPENIYSPYGLVAYGSWCPDYRKVDFHRHDVVYGDAVFGFREAIVLSLIL
ncbi:MAG: hypothetical protein COV70_00695 [Parcubacteria group bacterium CG11_big_fil_rev_8_21_14_0_20_39_22]|nr:MAG: hypothetical protein COV70_00695 [Parcubacteria group bacterium CG11_big_fil_rev_8_21_14_0_20_39_22]